MCKGDCEKCPGCKRRDKDEALLAKIDEALATQTSSIDVNALRGEVVREGMRLKRERLH